MADQPWLDGEVEVLDPLIDLFNVPWQNTREDEMDLAYAFMQAIRFYSFAINLRSALWESTLRIIRAEYEHGDLTRDTLKPALMDFDRFAKRVAERGEG